METGQAFAVAFGLTLLVLGGLYVLFRSELVAHQQRENPALPSPKVWLLVHRVVTALPVALCLYGGTLFLIIGGPNYFVGAGFATHMYALALKRGIDLRFKLAGLRVQCFAYVLGGSLCAVGFALHGGPIGVFGAIASLVWITGWLWALKIVWRA